MSNSTFPHAVWPTPVHCRPGHEDPYRPANYVGGRYDLTEWKRYEKTRDMLKVLRFYQSFGLIPAGIAQT